MPPSPPPSWRPGTTPPTTRWTSPQAARNTTMTLTPLTGTVIAGNQQAAGSTGSHGGSTGDTAITADQAKEIALNHAGLTADQVTFVRSNLDQDDGRTCYDGSSTPPTTPSTTTRSTRTPATSSPTTTTPRGTRDRARAAAPPPSPPTGPRRSPWPRSPAPPPATSTSLRPTGTTAAWSTRGPSTTTAPSTTSPSTATAAPSGVGRGAPRMTEVAQQPPKWTAQMDKTRGEQLAPPRLALGVREGRRPP